MYTILGICKSYMQINGLFKSTNVYSYLI